MLRVFVPSKFRSRAASKTVSATLASASTPASPLQHSEPVQHSETVHLPGCCTRLKVTCRSGQLHAHWACDCGASGIATPYLSIESARAAAFAAAGRHHSDRHAAPPCAKASA